MALDFRWIGHTEYDSKRISEQHKEQFRSCHCLLCIIEIPEFRELIFSHLKVADLRSFRLVSTQASQWGIDQLAQRMTPVIQRLFLLGRDRLSGHVTVVTDDPEFAPRQHSFFYLLISPVRPAPKKSSITVFRDLNCGQVQAIQGPYRHSTQSLVFVHEEQRRQYEEQESRHAESSRRKKRKRKSDIPFPFAWLSRDEAVQDIARACMAGYRLFMGYYMKPEEWMRIEFIQVQSSFFSFRLCRYALPLETPQPSKADMQIRVQNKNWSPLEADVLQECAERKEVKKKSLFGLAEGFLGWSEDPPQGLIPVKLQSCRDTEERSHVYQAHGDPTLFALSTNHLFSVTRPLVHH